MSPRVLGVETGDAGRRHPSHEDTDPPGAEFDPEEKSTKAQVASFRTPRFAMGVPAAVLIALIAAVSSFAIAWINKPAVSGSGLTEEQAATLKNCAAKLDAYHQENEQFRNWIEPQIGVILVRLGAQPYAPPPQAVIKSAP